MNDATATSSVVRQMPSGKSMNMKYILIGLVVVLLGVATGWVLSGARAGVLGSTAAPQASGVTVTQNEAGIADVSDFDDATGVLKAGGIDGEGTHHLEREGGPSKTVYLTSTVIDLESYIDRKVQVWGDTSATKKATWFMDVVKLKTLD